MITLLPKKDRDIALIKNWRPITLLNQDYKLLSKCIATRICSKLPGLINSDQTGFVKGRYIGENILRLINIMDHVEEEEIPALLVNVDFEKAFDLLEITFVDQCLKKMNFGDSIRNWVNIFYVDSSSCVLNNGWTTDRFRLTRGARQGCPLSPYLFIICAEMLACLLRQDINIEGITINREILLVSQYADDTNLTVTYSKKNLENIIKNFNVFQQYSGLKVNFDKTEIMPIGPVKHNCNTLLPDSNIRWISDNMKTLGVSVYHDRKEMIEQNYKPLLSKMQNIVKLWSRRNLTIYGRVVIVNTFLISQLVYLMSILPTPNNSFMKDVERSLFKFLWCGKPEKIKRAVLKNSKANGGIYAPDVKIKDQSLKLSWIKRMLTSKNKWNVFFTDKIPLEIRTFLECNIKKADIIDLTKIYRNDFIKQVFIYWFGYTHVYPDDKPTIVSQVIWYNSFIRIDNKLIFYRKLYDLGIIYIKDLLNENGNFLNYQEMAEKCNTSFNYLQYMGIIHAIPHSWKQKLLEPGEEIESMVPSHKKLANLLHFKKVPREIYREMITSCVDIPTTPLIKWNVYFHGGITQDLFLDSFKIISHMSLSSETQYFQFRLLHRILATNETLFGWKLIDSDICSFCEEEIETLCHIFLECEVVKIFWCQLKSWINKKLNVNIPITNIEIIFGTNNMDLIFVDNLYILAKQYIYKSRCTKQFPTLRKYCYYIREYVTMEKCIAEQNNSQSSFDAKWKTLQYPNALSP